MDVDEFSERLARVRQRFASALPGKIDDGFSVLPDLTGAGADSIDKIVLTHRKLHEMCGIAPTLGFGATGKAARAAESVIRPAAKEKRPLTLTEIAALKAELSGLRTAALAELQSMNGRG